MQHLNYNGIATLIGAVGGFITVVGTFVMQVINWRDQRRARQEQARHKELLEAISDKIGVAPNANLDSKSD